MRIDGKKISQAILEKVKVETQELKNKGITPTLAIILIGESESSLSYIKQKRLKADEIGARIDLFHFPSITQTALISLINKLNADPAIHGIIVQRPLPQNINRDKIALAIAPDKDIDGFGLGSNFDPPVALAVVEILKSIGISDLKNKKITVLGKGETAGGPIINLLKKHGFNLEIIDSQTKNADEILKNSDIIISAVGKENVIKPNLLNKNQILIGVGLFSIDGKLKGDYDEAEVESKVKYFTPTIGGVGPVNVTFLMSNLVYAARAQTPLSK